MRRVLPKDLDLKPLREILLTAILASGLVGAFFAAAFMGASAYHEIKALTDLNLAAFFMGIAAAVAFVMLQIAMAMKLRRSRGRT